MRDARSCRSSRISRMTVPQLGPTIQFSHRERQVENTSASDSGAQPQLQESDTNRWYCGFSDASWALPEPARHNGGVMPKTHLLVALPFCWSARHLAELMKDAAGNRSKADAYYGSKSSDPNWMPCDYSETSPNIPDSCR